MYGSTLALSWHTCTAHSHHMHLLSPDAQHKAAAAKHSRSTLMRIRWHIEKMSRLYHAQAACIASIVCLLRLAKADYETPFIADAQQLASWGTTKGLLCTHTGRYSQRLLASALLQSIVIVSLLWQASSAAGQTDQRSPRNSPV